MEPAHRIPVDPQSILKSKIQKALLDVNILLGESNCESGDFKLEVVRSSAFSSYSSVRRA